MFRHIQHYPGDPILGLMDEFAKDARPKKVNLGVGIYYDNDGNIPVLQTVIDAERALVNPPKPRPYLPMDGLPSYQTACQNLLFGKNHPVLTQNRVATVATIGGSGALKLGADFIFSWIKGAKCYVSDPTWANHIGIFEGAGITVEKYPYYDNNTHSIKFNELLTFLDTLNQNDVVLLHPCCHNPTGMDFSKAQWDTVLECIAKNKLIAFMDIAYQGFGQSMDDDAYAIRRAADLGLNFFVSNSFSKNLSLYGERVGGLSVVCQDSAQKDLVQGQLKFIIRRIYSSPPSHGGHVVSDIMNHSQSFDRWVNEVYAMRDRISAMRQTLRQSLENKLAGQDFSYLTDQQGMFSFTGLNPKQVQRLKQEFGVYVVGNGRMCVAGLNTHNVDYVADAMAAVLQSA